MRNLPPHIGAAAERVRHVVPDPRAARDMVNCVDLTVLNRTVNPALINYVCRDADQGTLGKAASITVHPNFLSQTFNNSARRRVPVATVINYPDGRGTPEQTQRETRSAIVRGASEIEIVLDHNALKDGRKDAVRAVLFACRVACGGDAKMKVVLESSAFQDYQSLYDAADLAISCGADMLVTATETNTARSGTTLAAAATILQAIKDNGKKTGLKVAGEEDSVRAYAPYMALARQMMGDGWVKPDNFRIAGRSLITEAARIANPPPRLGNSSGI